MKRIISLLSIIWLCLTSINANELRFIYIAHDIETATDKLVQELNGLQRAARDGVPTIFYLSNSDKPIIAYYNINNKQDGEKYREIMGELQEHDYHDTSAIDDRDSIVNIFTKLKIENGNYSKVVWKFYITQRYFDDNFNEAVIASTYFILNIAEWTKPSFLLQLYFSGQAEIQIDKKYPFGILNLCPTLNNNYELITL